MQQGKPIAFCSRSLTETESRWAQIEKEYLAISYSLSKFHQFVFGRHVTVKSDQKPLGAIHKKDIYKVSGFRPTSFHKGIQGIIRMRYINWFYAAETIDLGMKCLVMYIRRFDWGCSVI